MGRNREKSICKECPKYFCILMVAILFFPTVHPSWGYSVPFFRKLHHVTSLYNSKKGCQFKGWTTNEHIEVVFARRNWFYPSIPPPSLHLLPNINKRSNLIILSLYNGGVIYISPLSKFLSFKGRFPYRPGVF